MSSLLYTGAPRSDVSPITFTNGLLQPLWSPLLDGLYGIRHHQYTSISSFMDAIKEQERKIASGDASQYMIFTPVTKSQLSRIDRKRGSFQTSLRFMYCGLEKVLVVKLMPSQAHEKAHLIFSSIIISRLPQMGLSAFDIFSVGGTRFTSNTNSKEADSAFKPLSREKVTDWPTLVIESGMSESLARLRVDAAWWLTNSGGEVKIVLLVAITPAVRRLQIEAWESQASHSLSTPYVPVKTQDISITGDTIIGAPLILGFENIFLRQPQPPEQDFYFSVQDLQNIARHLWSGIE